MSVYVIQGSNHEPGDPYVDGYVQNLLFFLSAGYPSCSALPDRLAGPDNPSFPGQEEASRGDGGSVGPERGAGEEVSGLQEGAG